MKRINQIKDGKSNFLLSSEKRLQKVLSDVFTKSSFSFENKQVFVNVLFVDMSPDLKNAKVVIDTFGINDEKAKEELAKQLNKSFVKQIRGIIASKMRMKYVPEVRFYLDESMEKSIKINNLIDSEIKKMGLDTNIE